MKSTSSAAFGVAAGVATGSWSNAATSDLVRTFCRPEWFLLEIARLEAARLHTTEPPMSKQSALHKIGKACCLLEYPFLLGRRRGRVEFLVEVEQAVADDALGHKVNESVPDELASADHHADGPLPGRPKRLLRKAKSPGGGGKTDLRPVEAALDTEDRAAVLHNEDLPRALQRHNQQEQRVGEDPGKAVALPVDLSGIDLVEQLHQDEDVEDLRSAAAQVRRPQP